jgi:ABC-type phosphate transport system auxiliary subunit
MSEEDLKLVLSKYQQKCFEFMNQNIVLETQVEKLSANVKSLNSELEKLRKQKRGSKVEEDFS